MDRTGRDAVCAVAAPALSAPPTSAVAAPPPRESSRIPFAERCPATGHGGVARAADSWVPGRRAVPRRPAAVWDGGEALGERPLPAHARERAGVVAYHGTPGIGSGISARADRITPVVPRHSAEPANAAATPRHSDFDRKRPGTPACRNAPGLDSEVLDTTTAPWSGRDRSAFRCTTRKAGYFLGALFLQADLRH
ncbi:hypothetical protein ACIQU6_18245 [Streptomyces sp. NPDC090442]|uniref:hypothetical protein n=1 Tax=Streptomyces sp. NPDC090442 TaxID=3365962 RepID=UPI00382C76E7